MNMCDLPQAFNQVYRTARKDHKCCECHRKILKGEKYLYSSGIWDGEPDSYKQCSICGEVANAATVISEPDEAPAFTGLKDWFNNQMSSTFKGGEFISKMSHDLGVELEKIAYVLARS